MENNKRKTYFNLFSTRIIFILLHVKRVIYLSKRLQKHHKSLKFLNLIMPEFAFQDIFGFYRKPREKCPQLKLIETVTWFDLMDQFEVKGIRKVCYGNSPTLSSCMWNSLILVFSFRITQFFFFNFTILFICDHQGKKK